MQPFTERIHMEADEEILLVVRKHWFVLLRDSFVPILLFIVPISLYLFASETLFTIEAIAKLPHTNAVMLFVISFWGLISWMMLFMIWTDYYLDMWTITDRRVIAIDQRGFFRRFIASFRYEQLQDINVEINGFIETMLDFGHIHAQTAGHDVSFRIDGVPKPREIKALILRSSDILRPARPTPVRPQNPPTESINL